MKLHEAFKEVEELWEEPSQHVVKTFGKKTYDISKKDELEAWVTANAEFQMRRHPDRYTKNSNDGLYPEGEWNIRELRIDIMHNLLDTLPIEPSTKVVRDNIWDLIVDTAKESQKKVVAFYDEKEAEVDNTSTEDYVEEFKITKAELKEMIKEALREELGAE